MRDYELDTIKAIRAVGNEKLSALSEDRLCELWLEWSNFQWFDADPESVAAFIAWATTAPCDRKDEE